MTIFTLSSGYANIFYHHGYEQIQSYSYTILLVHYRSNFKFHKSHFPYYILNITLRITTYNLQIANYKLQITNYTMNINEERHNNHSA